MEQQSRLGIYWSRQSVTAVSLASRGAHPAVTQAFTLRIEADQPPAAMAQTLMEEIRRKGIATRDCFVAVDASFYTQHNLHTAFTDYKQIVNTIKFDTEEAIATDATNLAIAFSVTDSDDNGSSVAVYTSERAGMLEIVNALLSAGFDPETVEPDILCLARFFQQCFVTPGTMRPLFVVFGDKTCYILSFNDAGQPRVRSFVLSASATKTQTLSREIPLTIAAMNAGGSFTGIFIAGTTEGLETAILAERIGMPVEIVDGIKLTGTGLSLLGDGTPPAAYLAAYAAALPVTRNRRADFRADTVPYQGRRKVLEKALRTVCVSLTVILLAIGLNLQAQASRHNRTIQELKDKLLADYEPVMNSDKLPTTEKVSGKLMRTLSQLEKAAKGLGSGDENSVVSRLTYILEGLNAAMQVAEGQSANKVGLEIDQIKIAPKSVTLKGSTSGRSQTLAMMEAFRKGGKLNPTHVQHKEAGNRDEFQIGLEPGQPPAPKSVKLQEAKK
ncbi:MAG: hypothetical protein GX455_04390 [Phycisphaerae bacterium]|nr:hypothetical protein [Phycisphaerae bacterium]